jgi:hypothetical protein
LPTAPRHFAAIAPAACPFVRTQFTAENYFPPPCLLAVDAVAFRALRPWPLSRACRCFVRIKFVVVFNAAVARLDRRENKRSERYRRSWGVDQMVLCFHQRGACPPEACVPAASACAGQVATGLNRQLPGWIFHPLVLRALVAHQIFPIFSVVALCPRGASAVSVRRQTFTTGC